MSHHPLFWNPDEGRYRLFWRLVGGLVLVLVLGLPLSAVTLLLLFSMSVILGVGLNELDEVFGGSTAQPLQLLQQPVYFFLNSWTMLVVAAVVVAIAARWIDRRAWRDYGFRVRRRGWRADLWFGLALGGLLMTLIFVVELVAGWVRVTGTMRVASADVPFPIAALLLALSFIAVGIYEELLFRGWLFKNLGEGLNSARLGPRGAILWAWAISSVLFGAAHLGNPNATAVSTLNLVLSGVLLGAGYALTGELALPIGLHISWNWFQGAFFGFPVSGLAPAASVLAIDQSGPPLWTGGPFGPEAGLLGVLAIALGVALTVWWVRRREGAAFLARWPGQTPAESIVRPPLEPGRRV